MARSTNEKATAAVIEQYSVQFMKLPAMAAAAIDEDPDVHKHSRIYSQAVRARLHPVPAYLQDHPVPLIYTARTSARRVQWEARC